MMFSYPARDFFCRAVIHAKQMRRKELNIVEADLIIAEDLFLKLQKKGFIGMEASAGLDSRIQSLKTILNNKKKEL